MNYASVHKALYTINDITARRTSWLPCRKIRGPIESDYDYFSGHLEGVIIEDCKKECDCKIGIWSPVNEDKKADDWEIFDKDGRKMPAEELEPERSVATKV